VTLETIDLSNGTARRLLSNEEMKEFLWLPQGRILYTACRPDIHGFSCNYWEMRVNPDTGEPLGGQRPLTQWAGFYMANTGATADGNRLAFQRESKQLDVYVADFDARSLKLTRPRRLTHEEGLNFPTGCSRDGAAVIFGSNRNGRWGIFQQRIDESSAIPIATSLETIPKETPLTPDGKWLFQLSYPKDSPWFLNLLYPSGTGFSPPGQLSRIPVDGGPPETILSDILGVRCTAHQSAFCAVAAKTVDGKALVFTGIDWLKGEEKTLARFETDDPAASYDWDLSPDGSSIVVFKLMSGSIHLIKLPSGQDREINVAGWNGLRSVKRPDKHYC